MTEDRIFDLCCSILQNSEDGDRLKPNDLYMVQEAANGNLTPRGEVVLFQLNHKVTTGEYFR